MTARSAGWARRRSERSPPNGFGLVDMIGNVWEWTTTQFSAHHRLDGPVRVLLWASWSRLAGDIRSSAGSDNQPDAQRRLSPVRAGVLPPLPPGGSLAPVTGQRDDAHRVPLRGHFKLTRRSGPRAVETRREPARARSRRYAATAAPTLPRGRAPRPGPRRRRPCRQVSVVAACGHRDCRESRRIPCRRRQVRDQGPPACLAGHLLCALRVAAVHQHPCASCGEPDSGGVADAGRRTCDQHDRVGQLHRCRPTPP